MIGGTVASGGEAELEQFEHGFGGVGTGLAAVRVTTA
jgi:hypothetical protein